MPRTFLIALLLVGLLVCSSQAARPKDLQFLPVEISFLEAKGQARVLTGQLHFKDTIPVVIEGRPGALTKDKLIPSNINPAVIVRQPDGRFLLRTNTGQVFFQFAFDRIPVGLESGAHFGEAIDQGLGIDAEQELGAATQKAPPPVTLALPEKSDLEEIKVRQIQKMQFLAVKGVNMEVGGRYLAYSKSLKGSNGTVQLSAATYFGGAGDESFLGGGFLKDGSIVAVLNLTQLDFCPSPTATVVGQDRPLADVPLPTTSTTRAPRIEGGTAPVLVKYSSDLKKIDSITRWAWGTAGLSRVVVTPDGRVYISGMGLQHFASLWKLAGQARQLTEDKTNDPPPVGAGFVAKLTENLAGIEWIVASEGGMSFGLAAEGNLLAMAQGKYWWIDPQGQVKAADAIKTKITSNKMGLTVSPYDSSYYHGGDYNSGTGFEPYRNPYLHRVLPDGTVAWTAWNWTGPTVGTYFRQVSDSRAARVRFCRDGDILVVGWSDGGNSVLCNQPYDLEKFHKLGALHDMSAASVGSFAHLLRMDARTMTVKASTMWISYMPYASLGKPNSGYIQDLVELPDGRIAMQGGTAFATLETPDAWVRPFIADYRDDPKTARPKAGACFVMFDVELKQIEFSTLVPGVTSCQLANRGKSVLLIGGAAGEVTNYGTTLRSLTRAAVQEQFGGGRTDAYIMLVDTAATK